ncbi:MAG: hypothetical protein M1838_002110 [Thelocarpon superellum]|nr:MAG: hypothetical protein M1838_002110 [Thelocarpon superellum]
MAPAPPWSHDASMPSRSTISSVGAASAPNSPSPAEAILERLQQHRSSLSPDSFAEKVFKAFVRSNNTASAEGEVMGTPFLTIVGHVNVRCKQDLAFDKLATLTDGPLVITRPDFYDGAHPQQIQERLQEELDSYVIASRRVYAPVVPNFFVGVKGPEDSSPIYDQKAYTITSTYHSCAGLLRLLTIHLAPSPDDERIPGSAKDFRDGVRAFRNAREWAREQRDAFIAAASLRGL